MKKKIVSREVADFLAQSDNGVANWEDDLLSQHAQAYGNGFENIKDEAKCMSEYSPLELARLLINGYEVELTPEEYVLDMYLNCKHSHDDDDDTYARGILWTLDTLGIQIKGINKK